MSQEIFTAIKDSIIGLKTEETARLVGKALDDGIPALEIIDSGLIKGIEVIGERFKNNEVFLPEVIIAARSFQAGFTLLEPHLKKGEYKAKGTVVLGTVQGDIHDIGKNIVAAIFKGNGYQVIDAGSDVQPQRFVEIAVEEDAQIIGMSALLTTTMPKMKDTIEILGERGLRDRIKVIVGGAPLNDRFATEIGADAYCQDAIEGIKAVAKLIQG